MGWTSGSAFYGKRVCREGPGMVAGSWVDGKGEGMVAGSWVVGKARAW